MDLEAGHQQKIETWITEQVGGEQNIFKYMYREFSSDSADVTKLVKGRQEYASSAGQ